MDSDRDEDTGPMPARAPEPAGNLDVSFDVSALQLAFDASKQPSLVGLTINLTRDDARRLRDQLIKLLVQVRR